MKKKIRNKKFKTLYLLWLLGLSGLSGLLNMAHAANISSSPITLHVISQTIHIHQKSKQVYNILQTNGRWGYTGVEGKTFNVIVDNQTQVPTAIHWHGLLVPNRDDGVPGVTQNPILPGHSMQYTFPLVQSGTYWMHSHEGLQVQDLMAAPLIILNPHSRYPKDQQVVVLFEDFSFQSPEQILKNLQNSSARMQMGMNQSMNMGTSKPDLKPDLNDVHYDAFLTNRHTLQNPQVISVKPNSWVRLRVIDGASGSNFWIHLGQLKGEAIAFDGKNIQPLPAPQFQLAMGQRIDIRVHIPASGGAFPILGQVEGTDQQTGLILVTPHAQIPLLSETASQTAPALNNQQELLMKSLHPLPPRPITQVVTLNLTGDMQKYIWKINGQTWPDITPIKIREGARVEMIFNNLTSMAHPMHLHGQVFELTAIDHQPIHDGPLHDTLLILPHTQDTVTFDADHPGKWVLHCHMAYHQASGMMTMIEVGS